MLSCQNQTNQSFEMVDVNVSFQIPSQTPREQLLPQQDSSDQPDKITEHLPEAVKADDKKTKKDKNFQEAEDDTMAANQRLSKNHTCLKL
jgi:hypothetical protein